MKHSVLKKMAGMILACIMVLSLLPSIALTAHAATNVGGTYFASNFVDGDALVLIEDTTIFVNEDITLRSISGDYALEIHSDGEHTLTVDNPNGSAIYVKTLKSVKPSQGTVNLTIKGGDDYFAIATTGDISFDGTKLDAKGGAGIRSEEGNVTINGTNVSVVGSDGIGVVANSGSISIDSDYLFVQCAGQSGDAMWEHGIGALKDITIISDDATIAGRYGVASDEGDISLTGTFWVGARNSAICATAGNITVNGDLTANNTDGNYYCVVSGEGDITLSNGTFNITSASNAVITHNGDIYLNGDITVSSSETDSCAINAREGDIVIQGGSLDVTTGGTHALGAANGNIEITQPLQIVVPQDGRVDTNNLVNGSVIVDANGDPVSHVEIATVITDEINVWINAPVGGEKPVTSSKEVYGWNSDCTVKSITWYENDVKFNGSNFTAGENYKVEIVLSAKDGYVFQTGVSGKINGKTASTGTNNGRKELILTYGFGKCPAVIKNVDLTIPAPSNGNTISYSVTDESSGYSVGGNSNYVSWYVSDNGVDYTLMTSGDKFVGGKYYKVEMEVKTHTGYEFALKDVGTIQPDVSATVNGYKATVVKTYEQDPSENITVQYNFGLCNNTIIEEINIVDVPKPVPGEKPVYTVAVSGTGYSITNKNTSQEVFEGGQYVDKYYIRNGIGWYDVTADNWIYETDTFIAGHDYQCVVYVQTDDGCEFIQDLYANPEVWPTATVNGNAATILKEGSGLTTNQQVRYTFVYEVQNVSNVEVSDVDTPVGNKAPDYTGTLGNAGLYEFAPYGYELAGFWWYDSEDNALTASDKFVKGETYKLEIKLVRKMDGQRVLTQFQTPVTATLNGKAVDSADVLANTTTVYIYQTYTCDSEYLIEIPSANVTVNEPVAGEKPSYEATPDDSDKYTVTINSWYAESVTRNIFGPNDAFVEGASYYVKVTFTPKAGYTFTEDTVFTINGKSVTTWGRDGQEQTSFTAIENTKDYDITVTNGTASVGDGASINTAKMGTTVTLTANQAPVGQQFDKWIVNGVVVADANSATASFVMPAGNVTAEATYKDIPVVTYTVIFDANGGMGSMATATGVSGDYILPVCGFTAPAGQQFKAWNVGGVEKDAGAIITVNTNTTVTAVWEDIPVVTYTVSFDSVGGSAVTAQTIEAGQKVTKPADPTKSGFDFKGWTLNGSAYDFNTAVNGDITLVATWEQQQVVPTTYTVSFDKNGGTGTMADVTNVSGEYTLPANGFTAPDGKQFRAWSVYGVLKAVGEKITVTEDITVIAMWEDVPVHSHDYDGWDHDNNDHWPVCDCGHTGEREAHYDRNRDGACDICARNVPVPETSSNPSTPSNPNTPSNSDTPAGSNSPHTGDNSRVGLWMALMVMAGLGMCVIFYGKKRQF